MFDDNSDSFDFDTDFDGYVSFLETCPEIIEQIRCELKIGCADMILNNQDIKANHRKWIYWLLTGNRPPKINQGRKPTSDRDMYLAKIFLSIRKKHTKSSGKLIPIIGEMFDLPGQSNVEHQLFYKALNRGIIELEKHLAKCVESTAHIEPSSRHYYQRLANEDSQKYYMALIADYKSRSKK